MKRHHRILSIIVLAAAAVGLPASNASAGTDAWVLTSDSAPTGGAAIFDADHATGEYFYACDLDADGHWAYANFSWGGQSLTIRDYGEENGTCTESTAVDFPEGQSVLVTACLINKITRSLDYCRTALTNA